MTSTNPIEFDQNDRSARALIATIKAAVNGGRKYAAYVTDHSVTGETVAEHAAALVALAYPNEAPVQRKNGKRTTYGVALNTVKTGLKRAIEADADDADDDGETKVQALLTKAGFAATLEEVTLAWQSAQV